MTVVVVTPPGPDIALDTVKEHLRVDHADDDTLIQAYIDAACSHIDGPHGILNRAIWPQTLELRQNVFGCPARLPYGPVSEIVSIKYVDQSGTEQTADAGLYYQAGDVIHLASGASWPSLRGDAEGVRIRYDAGFEVVPNAIVQAVMLLIGHWYANRETVTVGQSGVELPMASQALLSPYRIWAI